MILQPREQRVVVPIDFSDESYSAVDVALELTTDPHYVHIIHVLRDFSPAEPGVVWGEISDENRASHVRELIINHLSDPRYAGITVAVEAGDAGYRIADHARKIHADLIVMPSHGRTGVPRLLVGSVAERVLRLASCPVLIMRN